MQLPPMGPTSEADRRGGVGRAPDSQPHPQHSSCRGAAGRHSPRRRRCRCRSRARRNRQRCVPGHARHVRPSGECQRRRCLTRRRWRDRQLVPLPFSRVRVYEAPLIHVGARDRIKPILVQLQGDDADRRAGRSAHGRPLGTQLPQMRTPAMAGRRFLCRWRLSVSHPAPRAGSGPSSHR